MKKVKIELSEEEYRLFLKFIYFSDYCADAGFMSLTNDPENKNNIFKILEKIYKLGDELKIPKTYSAATLTSEVRFSEEDEQIYRKKTEFDIKSIANNVFAQEFAKKDFNLHKKITFLTMRVVG